MSNQEDGGFTLLRQLEKTPKIEMSAKECMIELHNRLLTLRNRAAEIGEQEYIESLIFLAAKAHHKFDPNFLTPETVMRQCMPEPFQPKVIYRNPQHHA